MDMETIGVVDQARELVESYIKPQVETLTDPVSGTKALFRVAHDGVTPIRAESFDSFRMQPTRRTGVARLTDLDSFIAHAQRFKDAGSVVFANDDRTAPTLVSVLNYHNIGADGDPRFGDHGAKFGFPLSDEWKAWTAQNKKQMRMVDFAIFLEDRIVDVIDVDPARLTDETKRFISAIGGNIASPSKLMEIAVGLKVHEKSSVGEAVNLSSGEGEISFVTQHTDGKGEPLRVPNLFLIGIPVFKNEPAYQIAVRLRYRKAEGSLAFWFEMWRQEPVFDDAFKHAVDRVRAETGLPVLFGSPEV